MLENKFDYKIFPFTDDLNNDGIVDATWLQVKSLKMALTLGDPLKFSSFDSSYSKILDSKTYAIFKPIFYRFKNDIICDYRQCGILTN